jgi:drug/metabolite transporter (DMT)-like permease
MLWWILVLLSAVLITGQDLLKKKMLKAEHAHTFATMRAIAIATIGLFFLPFIDIQVSLEVLFLLYIASFIACISVLYATKAVRHMELSIVAPLDNLGPAFLLFFAIIFLGETPTTIQVLGIVLLAIGAYLLEVRPEKNNYLDPLREIITSRYIHYFLFAIILAAGLAIFEKYAMTSLLTPVTYLFFFYIFFMINFVIMHWYQFGLDELKQEFIQSSPKYFLEGLFSVLAGVTYLFALVVAPVTLVVPLRRASTLFTTIIGGRMFNEKNSVMKVIACCIMIAGAYLLLR